MNKYLLIAALAALGVINGDTPFAFATSTAQASGFAGVWSNHWGYDYDGNCYVLRRTFSSGQEAFNAYRRVFGEKIARVNYNTSAVIVQAPFTIAD